MNIGREIREFFCSIGVIVLEDDLTVRARYYLETAFPSFKYLSKVGSEIEGAL